MWKQQLSHSCFGYLACLHVYFQCELVNFLLWHNFFDLILYVPINNFSVMSVQVFLGWNSTKQGLMCLAQWHNAVSLKRLKPATSQSQVKDFTTESLCSLHVIMTPQMLPGSCWKCWQLVAKFLAVVFKSTSPNMGLDARDPVFGVCEQQRHRPG